jgi:hypothetical protein
MNYHDKKFKMVSNSYNGEVSTDIIFHYHQVGHMIHCTYSGGYILLGHLIGRVENDFSINLNYHQINVRNEISTGICHSMPEILPNGKIRIHEKWQWTSGDLSEGVSILEEI